MVDQGARGQDPSGGAGSAPASHSPAHGLVPAEQPFVNLRDPARQLGPDGRPARSRRAAIWADVPDEKWNDWRWQLSNRVNTAEEIGRILNLTDDERAGLGSPDKFRVDITPYFISLIDPDDPNDPIRRQVIPTDCEHEAFTAMMEDSLAEDRHSPVPGLVHRYLTASSCSSPRSAPATAATARAAASSAIPPRNLVAPTTMPRLTTSRARRKSATCC
jgi:hypothetical protein